MIQFMPNLWMYIFIFNIILMLINYMNLYFNKNKLNFK